MTTILSIILAVLVVGGILVIGIVGIRRSTSRRNALNESGGVSADPLRQDEVG